MFTGKVDFRWFSAPQWCVVAVVLSGAAVACGQLGGGKGPPPGRNSPDAAAPEQRLYPSGLPKIEIMLRAALEHHPDVLAARSKLRAAEAEQRQAELKALKELMALRDRWEKTNRQVIELNDVNPLPTERIRDALASVAAVEWELAFLLGTRDAGAKAAAGAGEAAPGAPGVAAAAPVVVGSVIPRGEQAATIKKKLGQKIAVSFQELPLKDVVAYLSDQSGLKFILEPVTLEDAGLSADSPITCELGEMELVTVLQALEDVQNSLRFVVRDYGILVTVEVLPHMVSARDFFRLTEDELREKLQQQRQDEAHTPRGGMGGGGFF